MKCLVTGGGGFLGSAIVERLVNRGDTVVSVSRNEYPKLKALGVEQLKVDVADRDAVLAAFRDVDIVFHVAAKAGIWGSYESFYDANVVGTENVIMACLVRGVKRLVYTSSPSVVFSGSDMEGVDESVPYPDHFIAHYPKTKAMAEQKVMAANSGELATVALRPHIIWGPGDNHILPRLLERARSGKLTQVGDGTNKIDSIYVDNAADAHLLAADRLSPGSPISGRVYFLSNGEPWTARDLINGFLDAANLPPLKRQIPKRLAQWIGGSLELAYKTFRVEKEPTLTRFLADELSTAHWFDITRARRELGYEPQVCIREGLERLRQWLEVSAVTSN
jgi:nucleoside-diphosphate-sugar epimerase